jgi:hypothetical protein
VQGRARQGRAVQCRAGQVRAGQGRLGRAIDLSQQHSGLLLGPKRVWGSVVQHCIELNIVSEGVAKSL